MPSLHRPLTYHSLFYFYSLFTYYLSSYSFLSVQKRDIYIEKEREREREKSVHLWKVRMLLSWTNHSKLHEGTSSRKPRCVQGADACTCGPGFGVCKGLFQDGDQVAYTTVEHSGTRGQTFYATLRHLVKIGYRMLRRVEWTASYPDLSFAKHRKLWILAEACFHRKLFVTFCCCSILAENSIWFKNIVVVHCEYVFFSLKCCKV